RSTATATPMRRRQKNSPVNAVNHKRPCPILVLTGERSNRHIVLRIHGKALEVTYSQFTLLVQLVIARGTTLTGFIKDADSFHPAAVWRLRAAIDQVLGRGVGKSLIETGAGEEYRLGIPVTYVAIELSYSELVRTGFLTAEQLKELRRLCRPL